MGGLRGPSIVSDHASIQSQFNGRELARLEKLTADGLAPPRTRRLSIPLTVRPTFDHHWHPEPRTKRYERPWLHPVSRHEVKTIALRKCRNDQVRFDESEVVSDALSRPGAERQVHELRPIRTAFGQEAVRIERFWILPECGKAMQHIRDDEREPTAG